MKDYIFITFIKVIFSNILLTPTKHVFYTKKTVSKHILYSFLTIVFSSKKDANLWVKKNFYPLFTVALF